MPKAKLALLITAAICCSIHHPPSLKVGHILEMLVGVLANDVLMQTTIRKMP